MQALLHVSVSRSVRVLFHVQQNQTAGALRQVGIRNSGSSESARLITTTKPCQDLRDQIDCYPPQGKENVLTLVKLFMASITPSLYPRPESLMPPNGDISMR